MIITVSRRFNLTRRRPPPLNVSNFSYFFSLSPSVSTPIPPHSYLFVLLAASKWDGWCVIFPLRLVSRPPSPHATVEMQFKTLAISSCTIYIHVQYLQNYHFIIILTMWSIKVSTLCIISKSFIFFLCIQWLNLVAIQTFEKMIFLKKCYRYHFFF